MAGIEIVSTEPHLNTVRTRAVVRLASPLDTLTRLLTGTGYRAVAIDAHSFRVVRAPAVQPPRPPARPHRVPAPVTAAPGDIVVTASKQRLPLLRYPGSLTVIDAHALLPATGGASLTDAAAQMPVLQSTQLGPGRNKIFIRGIADSSFNGATQSTASIYLDDIQLEYSGPDPGLKLYDMRQIEVLEGPQGTLYGAGAIGGIIRLSSNPVDLVTASGSVTGGVSVTAHGAPGGEASGVVNLPLRTGAAGLRVVGYATRDGGYIDDRERGVSDTNRVDTVGGRATLAIDPGDGWHVELSGLGQRIDARDAQYADARVGALARAARIAQPFGNSIEGARLLVTRQWDSGLQLVSATGLVANQTFDVFDASGLGRGSPVEAYRNDGSKLLLSHEMRLSRSLPDGNSWVAGFTLLQDRDALSRSLRIAGSDASIIGVTNLTRSASVFAEATRTILPALSITLGGRLTAARTDGNPSATPRAGGYVEGRSTHRLDPTAAFSWLALPGWAVFGRYQSGYRTGGLAVARGIGRVGDFRSDSIRVGEVGLRHLRSGATGLALSTSVSLARWTAIQADLIDRRGQPYTANLGDARLSTLEGSADWVPLIGLHATAALFFTDNRVTGTMAGLSQARNRRLPETPAFAGNAGLAYEWSGARTAVYHVGATGNYVGPSVLGVGDVLDVRQGRYATLNLDGGVRWRRIDLSLTIDNVTDTRANRFAYGNPFLVATRTLTTPLRPLTAGMRVGVRW